MDEFEKLESELRHCYEEYVNKFRCLSFLDNQWQELEKSEQQELEERQVSLFGLITCICCMLTQFYTFYHCRQRHARWPND